MNLLHIIRLNYIKRPNECFFPYLEFGVPSICELADSRGRDLLSPEPLPLGTDTFFRNGSFLGVPPGPSRFLLLRGQGL